LQELAHDAHSEVADVGVGRDADRLLEAADEVIGAEVGTLGEPLYAYVLRVV
jgi:hypothetical protein